MWIPVQMTTLKLHCASAFARYIVFTEMTRKTKAQKSEAKHTKFYLSLIMAFFGLTALGAQK